MSVCGAVGVAFLYLSKTDSVKVVVEEVKGCALRGEILRCGVLVGCAYLHGC